MKLGVLTVPFQALSTEKTFEYLSSLGVESVELGTGGYANANHCNPAVLLNDAGKLNELKELLNKYNLEISALSCHGNPVHPNKEKAAEFHAAFVDTCKLAKELSVKTVVTFSGCPGDCEASAYPNWVTCAWPNDFSEILEYQWNDVLIPYWKNAAEIAQGYGVERIALEMHPGFCVYNPETLLKLRKAVGNIIGANFDPSHLIWQGIDVIAALRELHGCIYHFHAKDTKIDKYNSSKNGVLDTKSFEKMNERSWIFRTIGYGNNEEFWKNIISELKLIGYDGTVSIEHEDGIMSIKEGITKAVSFLNGIIIRENPANMWWS